MRRGAKNHSENCETIRSSMAPVSPALHKNDVRWSSSRKGEKVCRMKRMRRAAAAIAAISMAATAAAPCAMVTPTAVVLEGCDLDSCDFDEIAQQSVAAGAGDPTIIPGTVTYCCVCVHNGKNLSNPFTGKLRETDTSEDKQEVEWRWRCSVELADAGDTEATIHSVACKAKRPAPPPPNGEGGGTPTPDPGSKPPQSISPDDESEEAEGSNGSGVGGGYPS